MTNWEGVGTAPHQVWREKYVGYIRIADDGTIPAQSGRMTRTEAGYVTLTPEEYASRDWRCTCHGKRRCPLGGDQND